MIAFKLKDYEDITVLGHILHFDEWYCDLRDRDALSVISNDAPGWDTKMEVDAEFLCDIFERILLRGLPTMTDWGNGEQYYQNAFDSDDYQLKCMLALGGQYRDILSTDDDAYIRWLVLTGILNDKFRNEVNANTIPILNTMLENADNSSVRHAIAQFGHKPHLDVLINEDMPHIRKVVAYFGHQDHLDILIRDKDEWVRMAVAEVGNQEALEELVDDTSSLVRLTIARRGMFRDVLSKDENENVRKAAVAPPWDNINLGSNVVKNRTIKTNKLISSHIKLDKKVYDADVSVRVGVAKRGYEQDLNFLLHDKRAEVRLAVAKHGFGLELLIKDKSTKVQRYATAYPCNLKELMKRI